MYENRRSIMKRSKILDDFPLDYDKTVEEQEEDLYTYLSSVIDHFESKFNDIKDKLEIQDLGELDQIEEAWQIVKDTADDLY
tara:strand:- start:5000 stop:5245 length:246 start_codon:yes stop_codon:yes gene_type:complete